MNKNLWIFNHYATPPNIPGSTRHFDFAKELKKRGYNVTIFSSSFIHGKDIELLNNKDKYKINTYEDIRFVWLKTLHYEGNGLKRILNMFHYSIKSYL